MNLWADIPMCYSLVLDHVLQTVPLFSFSYSIHNWKVEIIITFLSIEDMVVFDLAYHKQILLFNYSNLVLQM